MATPSEPIEKPSEPGVVRIVRGGQAREQPQEFDIKKYLRLMYKKRYALIAVMILVTGIIVAVGYMLPSKYEASSMVLIEGSYTNDVMKGVAAPASIDDRAKAVEIVMQSRPQVLKVLKALGYDLGQYTEDEIEQLVGSFQRATKIEINMNMSRRNVDMFTVSVKHRSPFMARDYVNALVQLYIEESQSSKRVETTGTNKFLVEQVAILKQKISGIETEIASIRNKSSSGMNQVRSTNKTRLVELRKQLHDLLLRYTPSHPDVEKTQEEIAVLEGQMSGKGQTRDSVQNSASEPLNTPSSGAAVDSAPMTGRTGRAGSRDAARMGQRLKELERDLEMYQKTYGEMLATLGKSEVSSNIEAQDKGLTFNVIEPAVLPRRPVSPNRLLIIILGFFAGIGAAMGSVIVLDGMDKSVKSIDMAKKFGHPLLAIFPYIELPQEKDRAQAMNLLLFAVTLLYVTGMAVLALVVSMG